MRMGRDFLAGSRKHEKLCLDLIMEERGQARSGLREKLQPGVSDSRDPGSSRGLEGENVRKIKGESGLSAIELAQLRGFAKFLPEKRVRKASSWAGAVGSLRTRSAPSSAHTKSVNVPPISTPKVIAIGSRW